MSEALKAREPDAAGFPARQAALAILSDVLRKRRTLDVAADTVLKRGTLAPRDAAFARAIAGETLRRFGQLDAALRHFMVKSPAPHRSGTTTEILLAGACELLFLNVAPHAAVDGANRLAQADPKTLHFKSLINAVLRRVAQEGRKIIAAQHAARLNAPDWLWERWKETYGEATADAIAEAHLPEPPLDLVFKEEISLEFADAEKLAPGVLRLRGAGRVEDLPGFKEGKWWVQDVAATMPARLFGDVAGKRVLDLCAAPGGKTLQLSSFGAHVTAVDVSKDRLARVHENLARTKLKAELVTADIRDWQPKAAAPFVLLDAPCTSTGIIRRHPDLPWIKGAADVTASTTLQSEMLEAAAEMTAPGGHLIYVVCSLEPEEGVEQIEAFLERRKNFSRVALSASETYNDEKLISRGGDLRTLPCHWVEKGGMDGFYAARLKRSV